MHGKSAGASHALSTDKDLESRNGNQGKKLEEITSSGKGVRQSTLRARSSHDIRAELSKLQVTLSWQMPISWRFGSGQSVPAHWKAAGSLLVSPLGNVEMHGARRCRNSHRRHVNLKSRPACRQRPQEQNEKSQVERLLLSCAGGRKRSRSGRRSRLAACGLGRCLPKGATAEPQGGDLRC